jgi:hypothetical protein
VSLTRGELFKALNVIKDGPIDLEKITKKAMVEYEDRHWRENLDDHPITSFWASQFPGEEDLCCNTRGLLYNLMNIPGVDPIPPRLRGQSEMGNAAERFVLNSWDKAGILLGEQIKYEDEETWLTGASDALLDLRPKWNKVLPVDIKSKDHEVIKSMQIGARSYEQKDYLQLHAYFYLLDKLMALEGIEWELEPPTSGILYYVSRQDPTFTKEFYIEKNQEVIDKSVETLRKLKHYYLSGVLPQRDKSIKWSEPPGKWCKFKKECCKKDDKEKIIELSKSNGIEFAKFVRPSYDYETTRQKVLNRWQ